MLTFVGLGLFDEFDITLKGLREVKSADVVYLETYTSPLVGTNVKRLEKLYEKDVHVLSREDIEGAPAEKILIEALHKKVVLLSGGDPMVSTTHVGLRLRAHEMGGKTKIIHAPSIMSAVCGITGLQNYKFGRSATIPFPYEVDGKRIVYETPYDVVKENIQRGLHTLLYLDVGERMMTINEGVSLLFEIAEKKGDEEFCKLLGVGIARAGSDEAFAKASELTQLMEIEFPDPPHILVITGRLHFMEKDALIVFCDAEIT